MDPTDENLLEELAAQAYYRERQEDAAVDREHCEADENPGYWALSWDDLSEHARRPYRTAVHVTAQAFLDAGWQPA